jgi:signal transduction histidine kinase
MSETVLLAILPVLAVLATTFINNRANDRRRSADQQHEERIKTLELLHSEKTRLNEEKRVAYGSALSEVAMAYQKKEDQIAEKKAAGQHSLMLFSSDLTTASARARLLLHPSRWGAFDVAMATFHESYFERGSETQHALTKIFAEDLAA